MLIYSISQLLSVSRVLVSTVRACKCELSARVQTITWFYVYAAHESTVTDKELLVIEKLRCSLLPKEISKSAYTVTQAHRRDITCNAGRWSVLTDALHEIWFDRLNRLTSWLTFTICDADAWLWWIAMKRQQGDNDAPSSKTTVDSVLKLT